uniref:Putative secreted protein n=1 Tax=Amblyomma triste TaxID=251400 RepID=A0A023G3M3_AMBTT
MRLLSTLLVTACLLHAGWCLMGGTAFSEVFKPRCFPPVKDNRHLKMGQVLPAGFTMSSFLDKLQLLEQKLAERNSAGPLNAIDMAVYVLRTFYHNDYDWKNLGILDNAASLRNIVHHVMDAVTANLGRPVYNPADLLDDQPRKDDDLCFLMFSLAHNVNKTIERPDRFETYSAAEEDDIKKRPREEGVLSVTGRMDGSVVALGKTLLGIAAAHKDLQPKSIKEVVKTLNNEVNEVASEGSLTPIYAATLGSVVAGASLTLTQPQLKTMGMQGKWLEHGCFLEYKLDHDTNTSATLAEITGAIDGLILGTAMNKYPDLRNWNLSTVLRLYYGPRGIVTGASQPLSHCRRRELFNGLNNNELREQVQNFAITLAYMGLVAVDKDNVAKQRSSQALGMVLNKLSDIDKDSSNGDVCPSGVNENQPECETPTDLLVVLDTSTDIIDDLPKKELQSEILAMITKWMKFQPGISSISLFASKRNSDVLRDIIRDSTAGGCPGCAALYLRDLNDISAVGSDSDQDVFNMLNNVVDKHISTMDERPGVASRVVVYLNLRKKATGGAHGNQRQVEEALNRFRVAHPGVPIYAIGFKDVIDTLNTNSGALTLVDITNVLSEEIPRLDTLRTNNDLIDLAKKICRVPASLRHKYCNPGDSRARQQTNFVGAVTTGAVQYWSYSTVAFSASKNLQIKFNADDRGNIKVCDVTGRVLDGNLMGLRCYETNAQFKTLTFNYTRPCKKGPLSCSPLTYAVVGKDENVPQINFDTSKCEGFCRNPQQIRFQVQHEGMYCAGVLSAMFSPFTLLLTVLALLRHWLS